MKYKLCSIGISILLVFVSNQFILMAESTDNPTHSNIEPIENKNDLKGLKIHVDATEVLKELGYTEDNMSSVPRKLIIQIIRSYDVHVVLHENGEYYVTITPDSPRAEVNLIGSDRVVPYDIDLSHPPDSSGYYKNTSSNSLDYRSAQDSK